MNDARPPRVDAAMLVASLVRPEVRAMSAYHVADSARMVKLDAMENPYPLPPDVKTRLLAALAEVPVNRYPDGAAELAKAALRRALAIPADFDLLLGNGSDELIQIIVCALARPEAVVLAPEPTFVMYRLNAMQYSMRFCGVPLRGNFELDLPAMLDAIERERPAVVFIAYPNNPTGNLFGADALEAVVRATPGLVVIDEAYQAFAQTSFLPRLSEFPNALVLRTLSKLGMAGMRLGYLIGAREWIAELNKVRAPYNVNAFTQAATEALLSDGRWIDAQARNIVAERARLEAALDRLPGVTVYPTKTNFVLVRVGDAIAAFQGLVDRGILVKSLHGYHPLLENVLRITVGTPEENGRLLAAMSELTPR